ncbi:pirin family protein [Thalassotalea ganghwensis]
MSSNSRELKTITRGMPASDGAGVKLTRLIGSPELPMLDPFLMLDAFESDQADDYIAGFPPHPHRGFETVTYMLAGKMRHKDSVGNEGVIEAGGVQWMTAGSGIIHSEMPEQTSGLMQGFQLWVNLPSYAKMTAPQYQEYDGDQIRQESQQAGQTIKVIAGQTDQGTAGVIVNDYVKPIYMDITLPTSTSFSQQVDIDDNSFIYVISGEIAIGEQQRSLSTRQLGVLGLGDKIEVTALAQARFILLSAKPLNEPVAKGGPFVMNTHQEVEQAFRDYHSNQFIR